MSIGQVHFLSNVCAMNLPDFPNISSLWCWSINNLWRKKTYQGKNIGVTVLQWTPVTRWRRSTHCYSIVASKLMLICFQSLRVHEKYLIFHQLAEYHNNMATNMADFCEQQRGKGSVSDWSMKITCMLTYILRSWLQTGACSGWKLKEN